MKWSLSPRKMARCVGEPTSEGTFGARFRWGVMEPCSTGTYGPAPRLVGLDPEDGSLRFSFAIPGTGAPEFGIHGGPGRRRQEMLYFGAEDDFGYSLDRDGGLRWKFKTEGDVDAPVVLTSNGLLLVGSDDGKLYALRDP